MWPVRQRGVCAAREGTLGLFNSRSREAHSRRARTAGLSGASRPRFRKGGTAGATSMFLNRAKRFRGNATRAIRQRVREASGTGVAGSTRPLQARKVRTHPGRSVARHTRPTRSPDHWPFGPRQHSVGGYVNLHAKRRKLSSCPDDAGNALSRRRMREPSPVPSGSLGRPTQWRVYTPLPFFLPTPTRLRLGSPAWGDPQNR